MSVYTLMHKTMNTSIIKINEWPVSQATEAAFLIHLTCMPFSFKAQALAQWSNAELALGKHGFN